MGLRELVLVVLNLFGAATRSLLLEVMLEVMSPCYVKGQLVGTKDWSSRNRPKGLSSMSLNVSANASSFHPRAWAVSALEAPRPDLMVPNNAEGGEQRGLQGQVSRAVRTDDTKRTKITVAFRSLACAILRGFPLVDSAEVYAGIAGFDWRWEYAQSTLLVVPLNSSCPEEGDAYSSKLGIDL